MTHRLRIACQEHAKFQYSVFIKNPVFLSFPSEYNPILIHFRSIEKFYNLAETQFSLLEKIFNALPQGENISFSQLDPRTRVTICLNIKKYENSFLFQQQMLQFPIPYLAKRGDLDASLLQLQMENHVEEVKKLFYNFNLNRPRLDVLLLQLYRESSVQPKRKSPQEHTEQPAKRRLTNSGKTTFFNPPHTENESDDQRVIQKDLEIFSDLVKDINF